MVQENCDLLEIMGCGGQQCDLVLYWKRWGVSPHENIIWIISLLLFNTKASDSPLFIGNNGVLIRYRNASPTVVILEIVETAVVTIIMPQ